MDLTPFRSKMFPQWGRSVDNDITSLQREMNDVMNSFFGRKSLISPQIYDMNLYPAIDIQDKEDRYLLEAELPGMKEDEVELDFHNNILTIKGEKRAEAKKEDKGYTHTERYFGSFRRDIPLEDAVDENKISAQLKQGILQIELMKQEKEKKTHRKIAIKH